MKTLTLSNYFEIVKPKYICLQVIPMASNRNYNTSDIAILFTQMYKTIRHRIHKDNFKFVVEGKMKSCYLIDIYKEKINFYFIVPTQYKMIIIEKIKQIWSNSSVTQTEMISLSQDIVYQLKYKNIDSFSLYVNKTTNKLTDTILNVVDTMDTEDRITVVYNFVPVTSYGWLPKFDRDIQKFNDNECIKKEVSNLNLFFSILLKVLGFINEVLEKTFSKQTNEMINPLADTLKALKQNDRNISDFTKRKKFDYIIGTQMLICGNNIKLENQIMSICNAYQVIRNDNELLPEKVFTKPNLIDAQFKSVDVNKCSVAETQNFLQLPSKDVLEKNKAIIEMKNVQESDTPKQLQHGIMCIGKNIKDNTNVYLSSDKSLSMLTLCIVAPTRSGKTTLIGNLCKNAIENKEINIVFDWCGNCDLSNDITSLFPSQTLNIDCSDFNVLQGLGYNELYTDSKNPFEIYRSAKQQASQMATLINSTMGGDEDLKSRMNRYLGAACVIVAISKGSAKDMFKVLRDYKLRHEYIDKIPTNLRDMVDEQISSLLELDKKEGETNLNAVQGILNRVYRLKENPFMELMLKKDCKDNFNLVDMLQKPQNICIRMPEVMFNTEQEKDTYALYWLTKVWSALQQRKWYTKENEMLKVNLYFDELYQCINTQDFLRQKISQIAKFKAKPIISCHYLQQIKTIRNELKSANSSYMLIQGCDKDNFKELESELSPYTLEDLLNLKRYTSLNLIKYESGYWKGVTNLPTPIK